MLILQQEYLCNDFKVRRTQRVGKFKSKDVSGIIFAVCNHITFTFGATIDFKTTETYVFSRSGLRSPH